MKENKSILLILAVSLFFASSISLFYSHYHLAPNEPKLPKGNQKAWVKYVIDGDTIILGDGRRIRYLEINAPEDTSRHECFGHQATLANRQLVSHRQITFATDKEKYDKYGRLLAYVWVGKTFVNEYLLRQGYARLEIIPPNNAYYHFFRQAQKEALSRHRGLWRECQKHG